MLRMLLASMIKVTNCRLYYISYEKVKEIEAENPIIVLKLYKLLSHLMTKRQEMTISQLGTLHNIMGSPACKKPLSRTQSS
jgi:CRP-like cAMP-binding protein